MTDPEKPKNLSEPESPFPAPEPEGEHGKTPGKPAETGPGSPAEENTAPASAPLSETPAPFIVPRENYYWGFIYTRPRAEKKLAQRLVNMGIRSYLPLMKKMRKHHRGKVISMIPMFTSYVFLEIPNLYYTNIRRLPEVLTFDLPEKPELQEMLVADLNRVRKCELLAGERKVIVNPGIQPGKTVLITSGSLAGTEVVVLRRVNELHVIVNLPILGTHCDCQFNADELQLLE